MTWTADGGSTADSGTFTADGSGTSAVVTGSSPLRYFWLSKSASQVVGIGQVSGLSASVLSSSSVQLSWLAVPGATSYQIFRNSLPTASTNGSPYVDTGLSPSTLYDYSVAAVNASGTGLHSTPVAVTTGAGNGGFDITQNTTLPAATRGSTYHVALSAPDTVGPYMWSFANAAATGPLVVCVMENHSYAQIVGSASAPYINGLIAQGCLLTNYFGVGHPSEPNYFALFSGSTQGVTDDNNYFFPTTATLCGQLFSAGKAFIGYAETGSPQKHNPWQSFGDSASHGANFSTFPTVFSQLPTVSFVSPNLTDDMHDGTITQGDTWLRNNLDGYVQWAKVNNGLFILVWDEDDGSQSNHVAALVVGGGVAAGTTVGTLLNHYSLLRFIEDRYGLSHLANAASAASLTLASAGTAFNVDYFQAPSGNNWCLTYDGQVECAPSVAATDSLIVTRRAIDNTLISATLSCSVNNTLAVMGQALDLTVTPVASAWASTKYKHAFRAAGGGGTYTFTISSGALPSGLSIATVANQGVVTGTCSSSTGLSTFTVHVSDGTTTATAQFSITVVAKNQLARPAYNTGSGFYVTNDGVLRDPNGFEFRIRGVNRAHWDSASWANGANGAASGANACRTFVDWTKPVASNVGSNTHSSGASLTSENIANGIVAIPCFNNADNSKLVSDLQAATGFWTSQAAGWLTIQNDMILNIMNEWGPSNSTVWRDSYINAVASLRAAGYLCPILIDSGGSGQDLPDLVSFASAVLASDPQKNLIFSYHLYGQTFNLQPLVTAVVTGSSTTLTFNSQLQKNPFLRGGDPDLGFCASAILSGFTGSYAVLNGGPYALSTAGGVSGAWTVKVAVNSTGLPPYSGNGGQIVGQYHPPSLISALAGLRAQGVCCIVGEFGPASPPLHVSGNTGPSPTNVTPQQVIQACEANGVGWLYWAWDDHVATTNFFTGCWFSATIGNNGVYSTPANFTVNGLDVVSNPNYGLWALAVPAAKYL